MPRTPSFHLENRSLIHYYLETTEELQAEEGVLTTEAIYRACMFHLFPSAAALRDVLMFSKQHVARNSSSTDIFNMQRLCNPEKKWV